MNKTNQVIKTYKNCGTIAETSRQTRVSLDVVRKELLNAGLIEPSDSIRKAREMYARGISKNEICKTLYISKGNLNRNLPRQKEYVK